MSKKAIKAIIELMNKKDKAFIQGNAIVDFTPFLEKGVSIQDIFNALKNKNNFNNKLDDIYHITSIPLQELRSEVLLANSEYYKLESIIINDEEIKNIEESVKRFSEAGQQHNTLASISTIKINSLFVEVEQILELIRYIKLQNFSNIKNIRLEDESISAEDLFILKNSTDLNIEMQIEGSLYTFYDTFFSQLTPLENDLSESYIEEVIQNSCSTVQAPDGHYFPYLKGLRILSELDWGKLNFQEMSISLKSLYRKQLVKSDFYHLHEEDSLHFYMVRVNAGNVQLWSNYLNFQDTSENHAVAESIAVKKAGIGIRAARTCLKYYDSDNAEVWVGFAADKICNPNRIDPDNIEMFVTMTTSEHAPFTMHMGIARAPSYKGIKHPELSMKLHSFIAQATLENPSDKYYMITRPVSIMRNIFVDACKDSTNPFLLYIGNGNNIEYPKKSWAELQDAYTQMKKKGYDKMHNMSDQVFTARLNIDLKLQEENLAKGVIFIPIYMEYDDTGKVKSFLLTRDDGTVLCNLSESDINGEFMWLFDNIWFNYDESLPIVTTELKGLSELFTFTGPMEYIDNQQTIGDIAAHYECDS